MDSYEEKIAQEKERALLEKEKLDRHIREEIRTQQRESSELWNRIDEDTMDNRDINRGLKEMHRRVNLISKESVSGKTIDGTLLMYFSGNNITENPQDYVFYIERKILFSLGITPNKYTDVLGWNDHDINRIAIFGNYLTEEALQWFNEEYMVKLNNLDHDRKNYDEIIKLFLAKFNTSRNTFHAQTAVKSLKMNRGNETVHIFLAKITKLVEIGWKNASRDVKKQKIIDILLDGVPAELRVVANKKIVAKEQVNETVEVEILAAAMESHMLALSMSAGGIFKTSEDENDTDTNVLLLEAKIKNMESQLHTQNNSMMAQNNFMKETIHDLHCHINERVNTPNPSTPTRGWDPNKPREKPQRFQFCTICQLHGHDRWHCWENTYKQQTASRNEIGQELYGKDYPKDVSPGYT